ncbi:peptidase U32 [Clostridium carboxidivorans P7]|uniref:Peptidase U32 n=1 Tax=Clostridium carboxidivorans P7 TaxID=536227 RepID=C6PW24_9CLOT|nr:U32 family peptidase [Clostridium carboxidivorans]EET86571.1 peptidase U32 [Clostridium carboxidivorans P7]
MNKIELLAPAGSMDSLYAAVQCGANAVYLGGNKFSARAYASNFDNENMKKAVEYCHLYEVKIYVTINTLMKEKELKEALEYAKFLYSIGVDALLVQDAALAVLIKEALPDFELHASTQMTVHNGEGAALLKDKGFKRIVLSRELSLNEIKHISKDLNIETEIFVHGALCVCYSGQCLMSSLIGGRSGNRGRCAQPCRLPYTIVDSISGGEQKGYLLSPKDICTIENIKDIIESGVSSLKIEGRMKRPEYVAAVVSSYRKAIDSILKGSDVNIEQEKKKLLQLFNREGFSKAYLFGNVGKDMMAYTFPKNTGVMLGKVQKDLSIALQEDLSIKDGIRNGEKGFTVSKIIQNGNEVFEASKGSKVKLKPVDFKSGDILYKTSDIKLLSSMESIYKNPFRKKVDLDLKVKFKLNEPIKLSTIYKGKQYSVEGELVQKALKQPLNTDKLKEHLKKSGSTPFRVANIQFDDVQEGFMPVSSINESRRKLIEAIENDLLKVNRTKGLEALKKEKASARPIPKCMICVNMLDQMKAAFENELSDVAVDIFYKKSDIKDEIIKENSVWLKVPNIIKEEFSAVCSKVEELLPYIKGIVTANLGIIHKFKEKTTIIGDYKLNIFNPTSTQFYNDLLDGICLSVELNKSEMLSLAKKSKIPCQIMLYGKVENMVSEYCVIGSTFGNKGVSQNCSRACEKGTFHLKDRMGACFTVNTDKYCRCHIYNSVPTNLIDNIDELEKAGINNYRIDFIDETYNEVNNVLKCVKQKEWNGDFSKFTRGHYKRGVE